MVVAVEGAEHAREIGGGRDLGTEAAAQRFPTRAPAEVVVPSRARGLWDEHEPASARPELERRPQVAKVEPLAVDSSCKRGQVLICARLGSTAG